MFKDCSWIGSVFLFVILLNMVQGYRSHYRDSFIPASTQYPQPRQNWQRSDDTQPEYRPEQNARYPYNEEDGQQSQIQSGPTPDWSQRQENLQTTEDSGVANEYYRSIPERIPSGLQRNLRPQLNSQSAQTQNFYYRNPSQGPTPQQGTGSQDNRRYDDAFIFKVQRNPEGKLNVIFNDTRLQDNAGLNNRAQIPIETPIPKVSPSRDIIFPGEQMRPKNRMSPRCLESGKTFCSEVENYPKDMVERVLYVESVKYEQLFGEDILPDQSPNITQRIDAPGEESLCMSTARIIYPQAGLTKDNNWSFIVNQPNYTQGVRIEECVAPGKPCAMTDSFPNTYTTECKQKFIFRHLVSMNDEGKVVKDLFQLPSCCTCILKSMTRFRRRAPKSARN